MTRRHWATDEQLTWLKARNPAYLEARQKGELSLWWPQTYQAWFDEWPLAEPTAEEVAEAGGSAEDAAKTLRETKKDVSVRSCPINFSSYLPPLTANILVVCQHQPRQWSWFQPAQGTSSRAAEAQATYAPSLPEASQGQDYAGSQSALGGAWR